jgi:hypothetical protein
MSDQDATPVSRALKLTPVSWSKERGFFWDPDGPYYRRVDVDALLRQSSALSDAQQQEIERLRGVLEADATDLWRITNAIKDEIRARDWVTESRGSYEWDDERYQQETHEAFNAIRKMIEPVQRAASTRYLEVMRDTDKYCYKAKLEAAEQEIARLKAKHD